MSDWKFKVLYDGHCPYCRLEVRWLQHWNKNGNLVFDDISAESFNPGSYGVTLDDLMSSIHGVFSDGRLVHGVEVFRQAYRAVGIGWILAPTGWPLLRPVFDFLYVVFARYRVSFGRLFGRGCDDGTCSLKSGKRKFSGEDCSK